jgi:hypothetical protein
LLPDLLLLSHAPVTARSGSCDGPAYDRRTPPIPDRGVRAAPTRGP